MHGTLATGKCRRDPGSEISRARAPSAPFFALIYPQNSVDKSVDSPPGETGFVHRGALALHT